MSLLHTIYIDINIYIYIHTWTGPVVSAGLSRTLFASFYSLYLREEKKTLQNVKKKKKTIERRKQSMSGRGTVDVAVDFIFGWMAL